MEQLREIIVLTARLRILLAEVGGLHFEKRVHAVLRELDRRALLEIEKENKPAPAGGEAK